MLNFTQTAWLIPCYALLGALLALPWSPSLIRKTGPRPAGYINILTTLIALIHSALVLPQVWAHPLQQSWTWIRAADLEIALELNYSAVTVGAVILITLLNLLTQIYAIAYLEMDWGWARFFSLLALFEAGMTTLLLTNSLFFSYVMLEILTLGTYLLIGFWFNQSLVVTGARDAFLTKRVGDLVLLMGVVALLPLAGTWNYDELAVWAATVELQPWVATLLSLAILMGPLGKCAQFPLHLWLDEAMEGPMPATVLRNAVVVSTGAWVLIQAQPLIALSPGVVQLEIMVGAFSALSAAAIALAQIDVKRVFSYLTTTYLGLTFVAVGIGASNAALLLLFTYAIGMALLLMSTGGIVLNNITQDLTQLGGLWSRRPISGICYVVGAIVLVGLPPLGCFWGFAELLQAASPLLQGLILLVNGLVALGLARVFALIFLGDLSDNTRRSPEGLWALVLPMMTLLGIALHLPQVMLAIGVLPAWSLAAQPTSLILTGSTLLGLGLGLGLYTQLPRPITLPSKALQDFFAYDFYMAQVYKQTVVALVRGLARAIDWCDRILVDGAVNIAALFTLAGSQGLRYSNSGQVQFYALSILVGVVLFGLLLVYPFIGQLHLLPMLGR
ncbi:MAG: NAD(P)H-quinone oxidoreductase subunit F [Cyanobacteria bacterium P01_G01_bin.54]